jgi:hypothetical protein
MVLRNNENVGTTSADIMYGATGGIFFGLQGIDTFIHPVGGVFLVYVGGSGDDHYDMGSQSGLMTISETSGATDRLTATGLGVTRATTFFSTMEGGRHLFVYDTASGQGVLQLDWLNPAHRVEIFTLSEGTFSFEQIVSFLLTSPNYRGDYTWDAAIASNLLMVPPGAIGADVNEANTYYKNRGILLENPMFAWTNTASGESSSTAAITYSGPVTYLDLQYLGTTGAEAIGGTAFSDFINAQGGDDAVSAGQGDDVLDGGTGSNFLTGGPEWDTFFLDGRGGQTTWGTITDWQFGEHLSLWGWRPGISKTLWDASAGAAGYKGVTLHADLDGDGTIDASVTWTGMSQTQLPAPAEFDGLLWFK